MGGGRDMIADGCTIAQVGAATCLPTVGDDVLAGRPPCATSGQGPPRPVLANSVVRPQQGAVDVVRRRVYSVAMTTTLLSDLVDELDSSLRSNSYAKNTVRNHVYIAREFLTCVGNIQVRNVTSKHMDQFFAGRQARGMAPGTLNGNLAGLRALFKYATQRRYIPAGADPLAHRRPFRLVKRDRLRIPSSEFGRLLAGCEHPQDRVVVALGLYLFLRRSEIQYLRVGDVNFHDYEMAVTVIKTKGFDHMPICSELDAELRRWLTLYGTEVGRPLKADDYLVPTRRVIPYMTGLTAEQNVRMVKTSTVFDPSRPIATPERCVHRALVAFGLPVRDDMGTALREGVHTLRRSGARALFDELVKEGYDGAMRTVQSMLHHASVTTTELYLGIQLDKKRRDELVKGNRMFALTGDNVIGMEERRSEAESRRNAV